MTAIDLLNKLKRDARAFRGDRDHYARNAHMHDITEAPPESVVDAVLTGFINYVGLTQGIDLAMYAVDIKGDADSESDPLEAWPEWARLLAVRRLTRGQLAELPEYSTTLPDSYKRPLSQGGRPWKRDLNVAGRFGGGKPMWVYCEYMTDEDPKMLGILSERVEIV